MRRLILLSVAILLNACNSSPKREGPDHVTVPLVIEGNRPFVDVMFRRGDGSTRTGRFLIDTGGGGFLITELLARDLGVTWSRSEEHTSELQSL